jgi:AmmeMemoRadiSam system protein A
VITDANRQTLLQIARATVVANVTGQSLPRLLSDGALAQLAGAFVSLHLGGHLRGCVGHIEADAPLMDTVVDCARLACSADPRFPAVSAAELETLDVEISILGPLEPIASPDDIEIGRHGLVVELGRRRGLLLPQVATEWRWDQNAFVEHTCRKAGLPWDAWKNGASLWRFEAEVFSER